MRDIATAAGEVATKLTLRKIVSTYYLPDKKSAIVVHAKRSIFKDNISTTSKG